MPKGISPNEGNSLRATEAIGYISAYGLCVRTRARHPYISTAEKNPNIYIKICIHTFILASPRAGAVHHRGLKSPTPFLGRPVFIAYCVKGGHVRRGGEKYAALR